MQLRHLAQRAANKRNLIVKARQFGFTTLYCIDLLDEALWVPGTACAILAHERVALEKIFEIVHRAFVNLPPELKPRTKADNVNELIFTHNFNGEVLDSQIYVSLKLRSGTVQRLHVTESAYNKDRQELNAGSKQAVPIDGCISEETTGNGFNEFYDFYMEQHGKQNKTAVDYQTYFYPWWENPEYTLPGTLPEITADDKLKYGDEEVERIKYNLSDGQLLWRRWKIDELRTSKQKENLGVGLSGIQLFKQEYPASLIEAFQSGVGQVFQAEILEQIEPVAVPSKPEMEAIVRTDWDRKNDFEKQWLEAKLAQYHSLWQKGVKIWKFPELNKSYVVGCDPSDGGGADYSDVDVWDRENIEQMAQFYGKMRPDELAEVIAEIGEFYNHAFVGVENNMLSTILFLSKIYDNYYSEVVIDEKLNRRTKKLGWNTNSKTRDVMIDDYIILFEEGNLKIKSEVTIKEMRTFVKKDNGKREHADGKHDDALFGAMVAIQMRKYKKPEAKAHLNKPEGF